MERGQPICFYLYDLVKSRGERGSQPIYFYLYDLIKSRVELGQPRLKPRLIFENQ